MSDQAQAQAKVAIADLQSLKAQHRTIAMLTAYDYPMGRLLDDAGVDIILVGDSLGMVVLGYETTTPVTMEEMLHHAKAVRRGVKRALLVGDMPCMSFHPSSRHVPPLDVEKSEAGLRASPAETVKNAGRFIQEAGCDAVKIEWKTGIEGVVKAIVDAGIPVMGHVGLTPQTAPVEGGFKVRGKDAASAMRIISQAIALQEMGCFSIVLECVPDVVAKEITERVAIPTIGIGAGPHCDGQVLVSYDLFGYFERLKPKFAKPYAHLADEIRRATGAFLQDVRHGVFPGPEQTFTMAPEEFAILQRELHAG